MRAPNPATFGAGWLPGESTLTKVQVRLTAPELAGVDTVASELRVSRAAAVRNLLANGAAARASGSIGHRGGAGAPELELHLLVAIEQVLALIESFLPQGRGAARGVLPAAVRAAQDRLDAADGDAE